MELKSALVIFLSIYLATWPAFSTSDTASHRQAVITLLELTEMQLKIEASVNNVLALQLVQNPALQAHENLLRDFLEQNIGWNAMKEDIISMYMQSFTETELKEINSFYTTPTGRKLTTQLPELIKQRDRLAMQRMQDNIGELQKLIGQQSGQ